MIICNRFFVLIILVIMTFAAYHNILANKLFYDDEELIYKNTYVQNLKLLPKYFTSNMIEGAGKISNMYRPVLITSFAIDYAIWGNNPFGYHLSSIIIHATNGFLVFLLVSTLFGGLLGFIASIFFIVHPVQTEVVSYASGRTDLLYSLFSLISIILLLSFIKSRKSVKIYFLSAIFFVLAIFSKETAVMIPFLLPVIYFITPKKVHFNVSQLITILSPFFLIDIIYIFLRLTIFNFSNTLNFYSVNNIYSHNVLVRFYTFTRVFFEYISILLFPKDLIYSRDISPIFKFLDFWVISFLILFIGFMGIFIYFWGKQKIVTFILLWFIITLFPVSGIIPINSIISEHYLYFPAIAFFTLAAYLINLFILRFNKSIKIAVAVLTAVIINLLAFRTFIRNLDWRDPITFYTKSIKQSPSSIAMRNNLAMYYAEQGQLDTAIDKYREIISIADIYPNIHHNLGNAYKALGKYEMAETEFKRAIEIDPDFIFSYHALIELYKITGEREKSIKLLQILDNSQKL